MASAAALAKEGLLRPEVSDAGEGLPEVQSPSERETGGRGLLLVEALTYRWGVQERERDVREDGLGRAQRTEKMVPSGPGSCESLGPELRLLVRRPLTRRRGRLLVRILLWQDRLLAILRIRDRTTRPATSGPLTSQSTTALEEPEAAEHEEESGEGPDGRNPNLEEIHTLGVRLGRAVVSGAEVQTGPGLADRYLLLCSELGRSLECRFRVDHSVAGLRAVPTGGM